MKLRFNVYSKLLITYFNHQLKVQVKKHSVYLKKIIFDTLCYRKNDFLLLLPITKFVIY